MVQREYMEHDKKLEGMDKRARLAELILCLVIAFIVNCLCIAVCKLYNKKAVDTRMQAEVNESVSHYFALA
jgi:hypothetical protein